MTNADDLLDPPEKAPGPGGERRREPDVTPWPESGTPLIALTVSCPVPAVSVVAVAGDLDAATVPFMDDRIREVLAGDPVWLVIDLEQVEFLGSSGLAALARYSSYLGSMEPPSRLLLTGATRRVVYRPLELTGLIPLFDSHPTLREALAALVDEPPHP